MTSVTESTVVIPLNVLVTEWVFVVVVTFTGMWSLSEIYVILLSVVMLFASWEEFSGAIDATWGVVDDGIGARVGVGVFAVFAVD